MQILPTYSHVVNNKLKHTYLTFDNDGNLIIKSPKVSQSYIEKLIINKSLWINKSREKILQKKGKVTNFSKDSSIYYAGDLYLLELKEHSKKRTKLCFDGENFTIYYNHYDEDIFQRHIDNFYKEKAKEDLPLIIDKWAKCMGLEYGKISFRKTKRQWGSCSSKNNLSFNTMIMKLPKKVMEYIVVHELAHIKHKHHQKSFWALVEDYLPNYKDDVSTLKKYTTH